MKDARRFALLAVVFLVVLRICIGWQLLYEGLWKYNTLGSTEPWSAEGYLKNAQGPFREHFHRMAGSGPYDLGWLDYDAVSERWNAWRDRFEAHYPEWTEKQKARLKQLLDGNGKPFSVKLDALPPQVSLEKYRKAIRYDEAKKTLSVSSTWHLLPAERDALFDMVPDVVEAGGRLSGGTDIESAFYRAVRDVDKKQSWLTFRERLAASLKGDADRVGAILENRKDVDIYKQFGTFKRFGKIDKYRAMVAEYERDLSQATLDFDREHLRHTNEQIRALRNEVVAPVRALDRELKLAARNLLTTKQLAAGPVPPEMSRLVWSNRLTILGLIGLGILLIVGFFTRTAAFLAAIMVLMFYLVSPPWPGVPPAPGPEHSLFVNKNLIEVAALLTLAFVPTGHWFGLDAITRKLFRRGKKETLPKPGKGPIPITPVPGS